MKQLVKGSAALTLVSVFELAMRFFRTKCIALFLGPTGTGLLAQLTIFLELLRVWGDLGSRRGVIKQIAEQRDSGGPESERYRQVVNTSYFLATIASCLTGAFVAIFSRDISIKLFGIPDHAMYVISLAILLPVASLSTVTASIMKGNLQYMPFARYTLAAYFAVVILTPGLIFFFHYWGALAVQALFFIFPLTGYLLFNAKQKFLFFSKKINYAVLKEQISYGFIQVYQDSLVQITRVIIATWIVRKSGFSAMGIYQVVMTLAAIYQAIPMQALSGYSLPLLASVRSSKEVEQPLNDSLRFLIFLLIPGMMVLMVWPEFFIYCFFSREFISATLPLEIQLLGTLFLLLAFPFGITLQARGHMKALLLTATGLPVLYLTIGWFIFDAMGLNGVAIAYSVMCFAQLVFQYIWVKRHYKVKIAPKNKKLFLYSGAWIFLGFMSGTMGLPAWGRILVCCLGIPWFILSSKNHEREFLVNKILEIKEKVTDMIRQNKFFQSISKK